MAVCIREILKKYSTECDINEIEDVILDYEVNNETIDDIEKPKLFNNTDEYLLYAYKAKNNTFLIYKYSDGTYAVSILWELSGYNYITNIFSDGEVMETYSLIDKNVFFKEE